MNKLHRSLALTGGLAAALVGCSRDTTVTEPTLPTPALALSPAAGPNAASSTTTMTVSGCDFTVTYTWTNFKGRSLIASYGLYESLQTIDASFDLQNDNGQLGRSGSVTHVFNLTANAHAGRIVVARGALVNGKNFSQVSGSSSRSSNTVYSTCG